MAGFRRKILGILKVVSFYSLVISCLGCKTIKPLYKKMCILTSISHYYHDKSFSINFHAYFSGLEYQMSQFLQKSMEHFVNMIAAIFMVGLFLGPTSMGIDLNSNSNQRRR